MPGGYRKKLNDHAEPVSDGINFAWYLMFWLTNRFGDERTFWKTMTPARCDAMYLEYARMLSPVKKHSEPSQVKSLSHYLMGGA